MYVFFIVILWLINQKKTQKQWNVHQCESKKCAAFDLIRCDIIFYAFASTNWAISANIFWCSVHFINVEHGLILKLQISHGVHLTRFVVRWIVIELRMCYSFTTNTYTRVWWKSSFLVFIFYFHFDVGFHYCDEMKTNIRIITSSLHLLRILNVFSWFPSSFIYSLSFENKILTKFVHLFF